MNRIVTLISMMLVLYGCSSNLKNKVGLSKLAPDEQAVQTLKPLQVPEKFDLPPPQAPIANENKLLPKTKVSKHHIPTPLDSKL